jgi:hypothetical protein
MTTENLSGNALIERYKLRHAGNPRFCQGYSIRGHVGNLSRLTFHSNITSVIDYGCGKAGAYKTGLAETLMWKDVQLYDPAVPEYNTLPTRPADLVVCIDVLEHIPESAINETLRRIDSLALKAIYLSISTISAAKEVAPGINAHVTVQTSRWWLQRIQSLDLKHYVQCAFMS